MKTFTRKEREKIYRKAAEIVFEHRHIDPLDKEIHKRRMKYGCIAIIKAAGKYGHWNRLPISAEEYMSRFIPEFMCFEPPMSWDIGWWRAIDYGTRILALLFAAEMTKTENL